MTEIVVHVEIIEEWKSVLDVWFAQGYEWRDGGIDNSEDIFENGGRFLYLRDYITYSRNIPDYNKFIEYADFMKEQEKTMTIEEWEKTMTKETYYVTHEQLETIKFLKGFEEPLKYLIFNSASFESVIINISKKKEKAILRYLGGDTSIEFKVKEQLYRLWRIDDENDKVYMMFRFGSPTFSIWEYKAFTAPLEEIKKLQTPAWEIEEVK